MNALGKPVLTLREFIASNRITMRVEQVDANPYMAQDDWSRTASHYKCTLVKQTGKARQTTVLTTYFSQGSAIQGEPTTADVLNALASDAVVDGLIRAMV